MLNNNLNNKVIVQHNYQENDTKLYIEEEINEDEGKYPNNIVFDRPYPSKGTGAMEYFYDYGNGTYARAICYGDKHGHTVTEKYSITKQELNMELRKEREKQIEIMQNIDWNKYTHTTFNIGSGGIRKINE